MKKKLLYLTVFSWLIGCTTVALGKGFDENSTQSSWTQFIKIEKASTNSIDVSQVLFKDHIVVFKRSGKPVMPENIKCLGVVAKELSDKPYNKVQCDKIARTYLYALHISGINPVKFHDEKGIGKIDDFVNDFDRNILYLSSSGGLISRFYAIDKNKECHRGAYPNIKTSENCKKAAQEYDELKEAFDYFHFKPNPPLCLHQKQFYSVDKNLCQLSLVRGLKYLDSLELPSAVKLGLKKLPDDANHIVYCYNYVMGKPKNVMLKFLRVCADYGNYSPLKSILKKVAFRDFQSLKYYVESGGDVNLYRDNEGGGKRSLLYDHAISGNKDSILYLIEKGVNLDQISLGRTSYKGACLAGRATIMKIIRNRGGKVTSKDGYSIANDAAYYHNNRCLLMYLKNGNSPNVLGKDGWTPLHFAARKNNLGGIKYLIEYGADITKRNSDGYTPLLIGIYDKNHQSVQALLNAGANPDDRIIEGADKGISALHIATLNFMDDKKTDCSMKYNLRNSKCIKSSTAKILQMLIEKGANPNYKFEGSTFLEQAISTGGTGENARGKRVFVAKMYGRASTIH